MRRFALVVALLAACSDPPAGDGSLDLDGDGKADRGGGGAAFVEVDASHTSLAFRRYVGTGLAYLDASDAEIARLTARSIRDGKVRIDEIVDLTCPDFQRLRDDLPELEMAPGDWTRLRQRGSEVASAISGSIDGFMAGNRVYVARGLSARRLAATLVHEVNHVINRSDVGYYDDLPTSAFLHEYRAFHAERLVDPETYRGVDLALHVLELYELDGDQLPPAIREEPLTPRLLPDAAAWRERRVEDDPIATDASCPNG